MSYCVNCGVELKASEQYCPLCRTEVQNPASPWTEPKNRPYPSRIERLNRTVDHRYAGFASLLLLIPVIIAIFSNLITSNRLSWSLYVAGAGGLVFVFVLLPIMMRRASAALCVALDVLATLLFLAMTERLTGVRFLFRLGLPLALLAGAFVFLIVLLIRARKPGGFVKAAVILFAVGLLAFFCDLTIRRYIGIGPFVNWSVYVTVPCVILSVCALILNGRANLKEEIRRRFFM